MNNFHQSDGNINVLIPVKAYGLGLFPVVGLDYVTNN